MSDMQPTVFAGLTAKFKDALAQLLSRDLQCSDDGVLYVTEDHGATEGEFRFAVCPPAANMAIVPGAVIALAANDLIKWTFPTGKQRLALMSERDRLVGNNHIGWWVTWNAGSAVVAHQRLIQAMQNIAKYTAGGTVMGDVNSASMLLPFGVVANIPSSEDITDLYVTPTAQATTTVGYSVLSEVLS